MAGFAQGVRGGGEREHPREEPRPLAYRRTFRSAAVLTAAGG
ncbi:hypothetical protein ACWELJ_25375 [Nocardia sp. NPDC004582]